MGGQWRRKIILVCYEIEISQIRRRDFLLQRIRKYRGKGRCLSMYVCLLYIVLLYKIINFTFLLINCYKKYIYDNLFGSKPSVPRAKERGTFSNKTTFCIRFSIQQLSDTLLRCQSRLISWARSRYYFFYQVHAVSRTQQGRQRNLVLRDSVPHFLSNSGDIVR